MCEECNPCCDCSCVRIAPQGTVIVRGYGDFVPLKPTMERKVDHITWTIRFKNGSARRFSFRAGGEDEMQSREQISEIINHPNFEAFIRAFWRRIDPYKNDYKKELPEKLPVQFRASMETALLTIEDNQL